MNKKSWVALCFSLLAMLMLVGCGSKVSQKDLMAHQWVVTTDEVEEEGMELLATFEDSTITLTMDPEGLEIDEEDEMAELGAMFAKSLMSLIEFNIDYTLEGHTMHLQSDELALDADVGVKKSGKNIILINQETQEEAVLSPY